MGDAWKAALRPAQDETDSQYDVVYHVAGIAHVNDDPKMEAVYYKVNRDLTVEVARQLGKGKPLNVPYWMAWCMAKVGDLLGSKAPINSYKLEKMTQSLTFSNEKARKELEAYE